MSRQIIELVIGIISLFAIAQSSHVAADQQIRLTECAQQQAQLPRTLQDYSKLCHKTLNITQTQ